MNLNNIGETVVKLDDDSVSGGRGTDEGDEGAGCAIVVRIYGNRAMDSDLEQYQLVLM
jgi:hypothetical protein